MKSLFLISVLFCSMLSFGQVATSAATKTSFAYSFGIHFEKITIGSNTEIIK